MHAPIVLHEVRGRRESGRAEFASERLLARVQHFVRRQRRLRPQLFPADRALKLHLLVAQLVLLAVGFTPESFSAELALESYVDRVVHS